IGKEFSNFGKYNHLNDLYYINNPSGLDDGYKYIKKDDMNKYYYLLAQHEKGDVDKKDVDDLKHYLFNIGTKIDAKDADELPPIKNKPDYSKISSEEQLIYDSFGNVVNKAKNIDYSKIPTDEQLPKEPGKVKVDKSTKAIDRDYGLDLSSYKDMNKIKTDDTAKSKRDIDYSKISSEEQLIYDSFGNAVNKAKSIDYSDIPTDDQLPKEPGKVKVDNSTDAVDRDYGLDLSQYNEMMKKIKDIEWPEFNSEKYKDITGTEDYLASEIAKEYKAAENIDYTQILDENQFLDEAVKKQNDRYKNVKDYYDKLGNIMSDDKNAAVHIDSGKASSFNYDFQNQYDIDFGSYYTDDNKFGKSYITEGYKNISQDDKNKYYYLKYLSTIGKVDKQVVYDFKNHIEHIGAQKYEDEKYKSGDYVLGNVYKYLKSSYEGFSVGRVLTSIMLYKIQKIETEHKEKGQNSASYKTLNNIITKISNCLEKSSETNNEFNPNRFFVLTMLKLRQKIQNIYSGLANAPEIALGRYGNIEPRVVTAEERGLKDAISKTTDIEKYYSDKIVKISSYLLPGSDLGEGIDNYFKYVEEGYNCDKAAEKAVEDFIESLKEDAADIILKYKSKKQQDINANKKYIK
ncbi:MAG: hypothetical protein AAGU14_02680, partial [Eubacteriaceae bacterium]